MMQFDWQFAQAIMPTLLSAAIVTVWVTLAAFCVAAVVGLAFALLQRSHRRTVRLLVKAVTEFIRSTPLLIQLYFLFFVLPSLGVTLPPILTGIIGIGLHYSCYMAEAYRAGLESVGRGQWEAAAALNYDRLNLYRRVVLPQAIPPMLPALGNYLIAMLKDTPLLASITVVELMQRALIIGSDTFKYTEPLTIVGFIFLFVSVAASVGLRQFERKITR